MRYDGSQIKAPNALIWWGSDRYLEPPPADKQPVITQEGALAVYNQVSDYAPDNVPRAVKLVSAHTAPAQAPFLAWAIGADLTGYDVVELGSPRGTIDKDCSEVVLIDATTGIKQTSEIDCPGVLGDWLTTASLGQKP